MWWGRRRRRGREGGLVVPADDPQVESRWVQRPGGQRTREPRQAAEQPLDLSIHARVYTGRAYVCARVCARTHGHVYIEYWRTRHVPTTLHRVARARTRSPSHTSASFFVGVRGEERRERMERARSRRRRQNVSNAHEETVGWLVRLARVCFTRTIRRYCYFCDQALSIPSLLRSLHRLALFSSK